MNQENEVKSIDAVVGMSTVKIECQPENMVAEDDPDATDWSSSFADTTSGEEESCLGLSDDAEVESQFYDSYGGLGSLFSVRKRKLTDHWKRFIQPLMWRCKWTGLKIKEFESQASRYNAKLAEYDQKKQHMAYDKSIVEESGSKSLPCLFHNSKNPFKRRKRKKIEHTADVQSYMDNHYLFSCRESKKFEPGLTSTGDDLSNQGQNYTVTDDFALNDDDFSVQETNTNSEEQILRKIDLMYSRVHKMKSRLDLIMFKNAVKFSSSESLNHLVPYDHGHTSSPPHHSPTFSVCNGGHTDMPDYDFVLPDSSFGASALIPDIIESNVGRLSSADITNHYAVIGDSSEKILDNILIKHEAVEMETQALKHNNVNETVEKHHDDRDIGNNEEGTSNPSGLTSCINQPKLKRKRGERKAGGGGWCRQQTTGEPDNQ